MLSLKTIIRALVDAFNGDNVYVRCECPDFFYRMGFWMSKEDVIYGERQNIPSDITNPDDNLGRGCKHVMLVLANHAWLLKVASVVWNYINYMEKLSKHINMFIFDSLFFDSAYIKNVIELFKESVNGTDNTKKLQELDENIKFTDGFINKRIGLM